MTLPYELTTTTQVVAGTIQTRNKVTTTFTQTVKEADAAGYVLEVATVAYQQEATDPVNNLLADIARNNSPLRLRVDQTGQLLGVLNKAALRTQWQLLLPWLRTKYQALPPVSSLLNAVTLQYAENNNQLETALWHKGVCGVVCAGMLGLNTRLGEEREVPKTIHHLFGPVDLPVRVRLRTAAVAEALALTTEVSGEGQLISQAFDQSAFQQQLDPLTDHRPAQLQLTWTEHYQVSRTNRGLLAGQQHLRAAVPGAYVVDIVHHLTQTASPAGALRP